MLMELCSCGGFRDAQVRAAEYGHGFFTLNPYMNQSEVLDRSIGAGCAIHFTFVSVDRSVMSFPIKLLNCLLDNCVLVHFRQNFNPSYPFLFNLYAPCALGVNLSARYIESLHGSLSLQAVVL